MNLKEKYNQLSKFGKNILIVGSGAFLYSLILTFNPNSLPEDVGMGIYLGIASLSVVLFILLKKKKINS